MSDKEAQYGGVCRGVAAMALFMQPLDATILNTALPTNRSLALNRSPLAFTISHHQLYADGGGRYSGRRMASRSLRYASHHLLCREVCSVGFSGACALSNSLPQLVVFRVIRGMGAEVLGRTR